MRKKNIIYFLLFLLSAFLILPTEVFAQGFVKPTKKIEDSVSTKMDSLNLYDTAKVKVDTVTLLQATNVLAQQIPEITQQWIPIPKRALWLALIFPGAGQIYNKKYWKLPIIYGGFLGCIYAMRWNNMMYKDYSQAYLDIMDDDPNTASYNNFLHLGATVTSSNESQYKTLFKKKKDYYRRYRDMSLFIMAGVYILSVIDAYVDAELSVFDISKDLSLKVDPAIINNSRSISSRNASIGLQCSLTF